MNLQTTSKVSAMWTERESAADISRAMEFIELSPDRKFYCVRNIIRGKYTIGNFTIADIRNTLCELMLTYFGGYNTIDYDHGKAAKVYFNYLTCGDGGVMPFLLFINAFGIGMQMCAYEHVKSKNEIALLGYVMKYYNVKECSTGVIPDDIAGYELIYHWIAKYYSFRILSRRNPDDIAVISDDCTPTVVPTLTTDSADPATAPSLRDIESSRVIIVDTQKVLERIRDLTDAPNLLELCILMRLIGIVDYEATTGDSNDCIRYAAKVLRTLHLGGIDITQYVLELLKRLKYGDRSVLPLLSAYINVPPPADDIQSTGKFIADVLIIQDMRPENLRTMYSQCELCNDVDDLLEGSNIYTYIEKYCLSPTRDKINLAVQMINISRDANYIKKRIASAEDGNRDSLNLLSALYDVPSCVPLEQFIGQIKARVY
jgi:hypothetical protein